MKANDNIRKLAVAVLLPFFALTSAFVSGFPGEPEAGMGGMVAACPFFTLIPDATAPTCNGFNNGVAAVLPPIDGVGPFAYQWIGGPTTREWHNVGAGTYTVIVIDIGQGNMACNLDVFVNEPGPLTLFALNGTPPTCAGLCNGQAAPLVIGGNGGYNLTWSSGETGFNPSALCATFSLHIEDLKGCEFDTTVTYINAPDPIDISADVIDVACFGDDNGSIDAAISGGNPPFVVSWSGPNGFASSNTTISGLEPGIYTIDVEDANLCTASEDITISENPELEVGASTIDNICHGDFAGEVDLDISGGLPPYAVAWTGPNGFSSSDVGLTGLEAGLYEATVVDGAGCTLTIQENIDQPTEIAISISSTDLKCHEDFSGEASASASGGSAPYTYSWTGPNGYTGAGPGITGLAAGTYYLEVTDDEGCSKADQIVVDEPSALNADAAISEITCAGSTDGAIDLSPAGGTSPYTINWSGPGGFTSTSEDITGLGSGDYEAIITDDNGCTYTASVSLIDPIAIQIAGAVTQPSCASGSTGTINLTVTNGTPPYSFAWTGPGGYTHTGESPTNLADGTYDVVVTDDNGCQATASFSIVPPAGITATFDVTPVTCNGGSDGAIVTTISGGTPPYDFMWLGQAGFISTDTDLSGIPAGGYNLMVTDANGCAAFFVTNVGQPPKTSVGRVLTLPSCFGASDGKIQLSVSGGTPPFTYSWTGPNGFTATTRDLTGLIAGTYSVNITDLSGCVTTREYELVEPAELTISAVITDILCNGNTTGAIDVTLTGGTPGYLYLWTGPNGFSTTSEDVSNLEAGTYTFELTDIKGCVATETFEISEPAALVTDVIFENISCFGEGDGTISLSVSGGTQPASVSWTGPNGFLSTEFDLLDLEAGTYEAEVTDENGCTTFVIQDIDEPTELILTVDHIDIACHGDDNGIANATVIGGTPPHDYAWTGPDEFASTNPNLTGLMPGEYFLVITDGEQCSQDTTITIEEPPTLTASVTFTNPDCIDDNGEAEAEASGGTVLNDYSYDWANTSGTTVGTTASISGLAPGTYTLTVTDDNGCTYTESVTLKRNKFNVSAFLVPVTCPGGADGTIEVLASNGVAPYSHSWTGPNGFMATTAEVSGLEAGNYQVVITDATGCTIQLDYDVAEPEPIAFNPTVVDEACFGTSNGSIQLNPSGGNSGYVVVWSSPTGFSGTGFFIHQLAPGDYLAEIVDQSGCTSDTIISVLPATQLGADVTSVEPNCHGDFSGELSAVGTGGASPYTFLWQGPNGFNSAQDHVTGLEAGTYILEITDANFCATSDTVELSQPQAISIAAITEPSNCMESDGGAYATATGGTGEFTYSWSDSDGNHIVDNDSLWNVSSGLYILTVTDSLGCTEVEWVTITDVGGDIVGDVTDLSCYGTSDGSISITVSGGTGPFTYEWSDSTGVISTDKDLTALTAGNYAVLVTDANGCLYTSDFEIVRPDLIDDVTTVIDVSCFGDDGAIYLTGLGGTPPYAIQWTGPDGFTAATFDIAQLQPGLYYFILTDANDCFLEKVVEVDLLPEIEVLVDLTHPLCSDYETGEITIDLSGGTPPYIIEWTGPNGYASNGENLTSLAPGTYTLVATDAKGCDITEEYDIVAPPEFTAEITTISPDCNSDNGEIHASIVGGVDGDAYTYSWTDEDGVILGTSESLIGVGANTYTLTVENQNGCQWTGVVSLSNPEGDITVDVVNETCAGSGDGEITLTIASVPEPYTVSWSGPNGFLSNNQDLTNLSAGTYEYIVTGADGCSSFGSIEVVAPLPIAASLTATGVCFGESSGTIVTQITGGTPPYTISWSGPDGFVSDDENLDNLEAGSYTANILDSSGCDAQFTAEVVESEPIEVESSVENVSCFGEADGGISLTFTGGVMPLAVQWEGPDGYTSTQDTISQLMAGMYIAVITDSLSCSVTLTFEIIEPESIVVEETFTSLGCTDADSKGNISIFSSGGTGGYFISWFGPGGFSSSDFDLFNLDAGVYQYTVTDEAGCATTDSIELFTVSPLIVTVSASAVSCFGDVDGSASVTATGGLAPRIYLWVGPENYTSADTVLSGLVPGTYEILVTDSAGCSRTESIEIFEPDELLAVVSNWSDASCSTSNDGTALGFASGGTVPYSFTWITATGQILSDSSHVEGLSPGEYELMVTDAAGCTDNIFIEVTYILEMTADAGNDRSVCEGDLPFLISGTAPNADTFVWTMGGDTLSAEKNLILDEFAPGEFELVLTASNAMCSAMDTLVVTVLESPDVHAGPDRQVFIEEYFTLGGNPTSLTAINYTWYPEALGGFDVSASNPGGYLVTSTEFTVTVTDENGCSSTDTVYVEVLPDLDITSGFTPNGDGVNDTWVIDNIELFPNCVVHVFNRWGVSVYESKGYRASEAWDGKYEGKDVPIGTYYHTIELNDVRFPDPFTGPLTIHR